MDILWPGFLYLLGLIPLLIALYIWILRRRKRFSVRYSSLSLVREALPRKSQWRRHIPFALFLLAVSSLIIALVRPVAIVTVPISKRMVILAIDVSRSMCSTDIPPSRIEAAKAAALSFVKKQDSNTQIGIVAFAGFAAVIQAPTTDHDALAETIRSLATARSTAIGSGILKSIDAIAEVDKSIPPSLYDPATGTEPMPVPTGAYTPAIIVLLTDGVNINGPQPLDAAQQAVDRGIRVYTIGFGTAENETPFNCNPRFQNNDQFYFGGGGFPGGGGFGGFGGFRRGIDEETLKQIADMSGGKYYSASSADELNNVFRDLPTNLITKHETTEISVLFAALGALLIGLVVVLSLLWNPMS
jgi:Ca-activated chloride channel family protein